MALRLVAGMALRGWRCCSDGVVVAMLSLSLSLLSLQGWRCEGGVVAAMALRWCHGGGGVDMAMLQDAPSPPLRQLSPALTTMCTPPHTHTPTCTLRQVLVHKAGLQ
eukprot:22682-Chlamydomonas_euryale.AAC.1